MLRVVAKSTAVAGVGTAVAVILEKTKDEIAMAEAEQNTIMKQHMYCFFL